MYAGVIIIEARTKTINIYYSPSRSLYLLSLASKNDFSSSSNSLVCISGSDMESIIIQLS